MTLDATKLSATENKEGSIEIGKYADFVVMDKNQYDDETTLSDELVQMTIMNGKIVYEK